MMAAQQPLREGFKWCGRVAVCVALVPVFAAVLLAIFSLFLFPDDCERLGDMLVCMAGHKQLDRLLRLEGALPTLVWVCVPLAVILFLSCRKFSRRAAVAQADQSNDSK